MPKRLDQREVEEFFLSKNMKLITSTYQHTRQSLVLECLECGRIFNNSFDNIRNGQKCTHYTGKTKYTASSVIEFLANKKIELLEPEKYENANKKLKLLCKVCDHKWKTTFDKLKNGGKNKNGTGCPKCSKCVKHTIEECKLFAISKDGKCLSNTCKDNKDNLIWECNRHNFIWKASFHNVKNGNTWCPKCAKDKLSSLFFKYTIEDCQEFAKSKNGQCLSIEYPGAKELMNWECENKHEWSACFDNIKNGNTWCPKCKTSKPQEEIEAFIVSLNYQTTFNDRQKIKPLELDIFIPEKQLAIEYCGLYWHGEKWNGNYGRYRHLNKLKLCQEQNIRLITIFEDEWLLKQEQVKGYLRAILGKTENKMDARKCKVMVVESKIAKEFHNNNHIQGWSGGKHLGLYVNNELIALSTFAKCNASRNLQGSDDVIELSRYTAKINYSIRGGLGKLLSHYLKTNKQIKQVNSYADNRWSIGNIYKTLKFELVSMGSPSYFYFKTNSIDRYHRYNFTKKTALKLFGGDPKKDTEWSIMEKNNWDRIWDCGSSKWVLKIG
jgi:hypothetical protein